MEAVDDNADFELARRLQEEEIQAVQNRNQNLEAPLLEQNQQDENQEPSPPSIGAVRQTLIRVIAFMRLSKLQRQRYLRLRFGTKNADEIYKFGSFVSPVDCLS